MTPLRAPRERDELGVDLGLGRVSVLARSRPASRFLLHPIEDLEPAAPAVPTQRVGVVGDVLELVEHEARDDERAADEAALHDLGDAAVDDRARVDDDTRLAREVRRSRSCVAAVAGTRRPAAAMIRSRRLATVRPIMPSPSNERDAERQHVPPATGGS